MVNKLEQLYEGKAKKVFKTDNPDLYWVEYKDDATAFDGKKKGTIQGKSYFNNQISAIFFKYLEEKGITTHFVELLSDTEMLVKAVEIIQVEVIVRNIAAGSLAKRLGLAEGTPLIKPVIEFCYKSDELGDPMINDYHIATLDLAAEEEIAQIKKMAWDVNIFLKERLTQCNLSLIDFKLEFGRYQGQVILADEISPDTCRFWDTETNEKLDKDRFRRDLGRVEEAYAEVLRRLQS
ncbi:phosphoribosylaminoimidazolesuccinocarboxamide synthase [Bacillota bacterium LX-D]|nr:phosphoribosylaminoimidazolesuccinocarboxamide synthase [Bacillota bacterium LX-D]